MSYKPSSQNQDPMSEAPKSRTVKTYDGDEHTLEHMLELKLLVAAADEEEGTATTAVAASATVVRAKAS
jgi:hypothetical protein